MSDSTQCRDEILRHTGVESHLLREIVRTNQVFMSGFGRLVGMSASRVALMRLLANGSPDGAGTLKIARQLGINAAAVTRLVKEMEEGGLVVRRADAEDGRRSYVRLSAKGIRAFREIHSRGHDLERSLSSVISTGDMAVAVKVLVSLRTFLESHS